MSVVSEYSKLKAEKNSRQVHYVSAVLNGLNKSSDSRGSSFGKIRQSKNKLQRLSFA